MFPTGSLGRTIGMRTQSDNVSKQPTFVRGCKENMTSDWGIGSELLLREARHYPAAGLDSGKE